MSSGLVAAVRKEILKFIQYAIYWEKAHTKKISHTHTHTQKLPQKTLFSLRSSNTHHNIPFNFQFFCELKAKGSSFLEKFAWGFHFLFHLGFTKVYFNFKRVSKTVNQLKFFLTGIYSVQRWTATTRHGVTGKRLKHKKIKASRKSL